METNESRLALQRIQSAFFLAYEIRTPFIEGSGQGGLVTVTAKLLTQKLGLKMLVWTAIC